MRRDDRVAITAYRSYVGGYHKPVVQDEAEGAEFAALCQSRGLYALERDLPPPPGTDCERFVARVLSQTPSLSPAQWEEIERGWIARS